MKNNELKTEKPVWIVVIFLGAAHFLVTKASFFTNGQHAAMNYLHHFF